MKNFLLIVSFRGTHYHGFQVQKNALTICEVLQNAMQAVFAHRPAVKGCSRTDAGVHARGYALSVCCNTHIPPQKLPQALNAHLPQDVRVRSARLVPNDFHARYSAQGKEYSYRFLNAQADDPLMEGLYYRTGGLLDEAAMHRAAQALCGTHDFTSFCAAGAKEGNHTRTISHLTVQRTGEWVEMRVAADGFLYNMVRILAGTLLAVGQHRTPEDAPKTALLALDRSRAGVTLPAKGLCLEEVFYLPSAFSEKTLEPLS